ncbi:hypothetical protein BFJ63_vAg19308 [Fusarium oxysporum f. sp. narcissi]|jgi:hypothetical protein|uniref:Uncharacterized protein n=1 Tax=Fusarium oxysporum f. sp. narcissi TaxID=451672 RepID=A0A4Q2UZV8_FUSOX|nr:hypothetical protein BFJ63_vAg19308 [Fusarium oxysporum f. sp. narcissi]
MRHCAIGLPFAARALRNTAEACHCGVAALRHWSPTLAVIDEFTHQYASDGEETTAIKYEDGSEGSDSEEAEEN